MTNSNFPFGKSPRYPNLSEVRRIHRENKERTKSDFKINNVLVLLECLGMTGKPTEQNFRDLEQRWFKFYVDHVDCNTNSNQKEVLIYLLWLVGEPTLKSLTNKLECSSKQFFISLNEVCLRLPPPWCHGYKRQFDILEDHFTGEITWLELVGRGKLSKTQNIVSTEKSLIKTMKTFLANLKANFVKSVTRD